MPRSCTQSNFHGFHLLFKMFMDIFEKEVKAKMKNKSVCECSVFQGKTPVPCPNLHQKMAMKSMKYSYEEHKYYQ